MTQMIQEFTSASRKIELDLDQLMKLRLAINSLDSILNYIERTEPNTSPAFRSDREYHNEARDLIKQMHRQYLNKLKDLE